MRSNQSDSHAKPELFVWWKMRPCLAAFCWSISACGIWDLDLLGSCCEEEVPALAPPPYSGLKPLITTPSFGQQTGP